LSQKLSPSVGPARLNIRRLICYSTPLTDNGRGPLLMPQLAQTETERTTSDDWKPTFPLVYQRKRAVCLIAA
jgi:hypothetical protein